MSSYVKRQAKDKLFVVVMDALDDLTVLHREVATVVSNVQAQFPDTFTDIPRWKTAVQAAMALQEALDAAGLTQHTPLEESVLNRLVYAADSVEAVYMDVQYDTRKQTNFREVSQIVRLGNIVDRLQAAGDLVSEHYSFWTDEEGTKLAARLRNLAACVKDTDFPQYWG